MEFNTLIETLDSDLNREITHIKKYNDSIGYTNPSNLTVTIDETTYTPNRLCLLFKNSILYLYINTLGKKHHKVNIASIEEITIGEEE